MADVFLPNNHNIKRVEAVKVKGQEGRKGGRQSGSAEHGSARGWRKCQLGKLADFLSNLR